MSWSVIYPSIVQELIWYLSIYCSRADLLSIYLLFMSWSVIYLSIFLRADRLFIYLLFMSWSVIYLSIVYELICYLSIYYLWADRLFIYLLFMSWSVIYLSIIYELIGYLSIYSGAALIGYLPSQLLELSGREDKELLDEYDSLGYR